MAREILKIGDIKKVSPEAYVIMGAYLGLDKSPDFKNLKGKSIIIENTKKKIRTEILDISISYSLVDQANLFLLIPSKEI